MKNEWIKLITETDEKYVNGFPTHEEKIFECFGETNSVKRSEYYQAALASIQVSLVIVVNYDDYIEAKVDKKVPSMVEIDGVRYKIVRTYRVKEKNDMELTVSEVGDGI